MPGIGSRMTGGSARWTRERVSVRVFRRLRKSRKLLTVAMAAPTSQRMKRTMSPSSSCHTFERYRYSLRPWIMCTLKRKKISANTYAPVQTVNSHQWGPQHCQYGACQELSYDRVCKARVSIDVTIVGIGRVGSGRTVERLPLIQRVTARQVRSVV